MRRLGGPRPFGLRGGWTARDIPSLERPYVSWCSGPRASGRSLDLPLDLQTPLFGPGGVLMRPNDGGIDDQIFEVRVIGHRLEYPPPNTLDAPSTEAPKHAVPIPKHLRKITPGRARTHDPQHTFHEHPIVAPGGALLIGSPYDKRRHPLPRRIAQNQT